MHPEILVRATRAGSAMTLALGRMSLGLVMSNIVGGSPQTFLAKNITLIRLGGISQTEYYTSIYLYIVRRERDVSHCFHVKLRNKRQGISLTLTSVP